jgi:histidyl-tRNA synthetase
MGMLNSLSGYPEWLPEDRIVEQKLIKMIQDTFELYGFTSIETRSVEPLDVILSKGETDKEIYCLRRLQATEEETDKGIGLHFDLTVPFARYVLENRSKLTFPFRRYQIQKAWRGERPGLGRYREFLQADIDIVDSQALTIQSDIEILKVISKILSLLPIPKTNLLINNRKLLEGFYRALEISKIHEVLRLVDKLDKIGEEKVTRCLVDDLGLSSTAAEKCVQLGKIKGNQAQEIQDLVKAFNLSHPLLTEGIDELCSVLKSLSESVGSNVIADLSIARGFDYYTGIVCEGKFADFPKYPTIAAGGRYDTLVSDKLIKLPGVGMSMGITRILGLALHEGLINASRQTPTCVLIALISEERRQQSFAIADILRDRGIPCEVYPRPDKYGKQISYADTKGIPYIWFPSENGDSTGEIRNLSKREQQPDDPKVWEPTKDDLRVNIVKNSNAFQSILENQKYCKK